MSTSLGPEALGRHARHIMLKEIGGPGVQRLRAASASIIGAGALGGPCAMYLAAAGLGQIEIWDDDVVERSNLQRQVQFAESEIGELKVEALGARLAAMNYEVDVRAVRERFTGDAGPTGALLIDASDNYETRFAMNALAHRTNRRLVSGAAAGWAGQVGVFASGCVPGAPCYRCFISEIPPDARDCAEIGVAGPVTGAVAARIALETLKIIVEAPQTLESRLWILDGLSGESRIVRLRQDSECQVCST